MDDAQGYLFAAERKRDEARQWFQKGLKATDLVEKEHCYIEALKLWPSYPEAHNNLADTYERQGRLEEALREYELAAVFAPELAVAHFGIGDVCLKMGRFYQAVQAYERGLMLEPKDKLSRRRLQIAQALSAILPFTMGSSALTPEVKTKLREMAHALVQPEVKSMVFEVQGHCDSRGTAQYNLWLSARRAEAVRRFLIHQCHIPANRLIAKGYGEERPLASNETEEGRAMNRRVQLMKMEDKQGHR
jgi:outer membrane protein OmpA-like peptidoglycan-associated protein